VQWLNEVGAPTATWRPPLVWQAWAYNTVEGLLRQPILAGLTSHNPGHRSRERAPDVLRDPVTGLPFVDERWRSCRGRVASDGGEDGRADAASVHASGHAAQDQRPAVGLMWCQDCDTRMWRGTTAGNPSYSCPLCHQTISKIEPVVVDEFLRERGDVTRWSVVKEVREGGSALLPEINQRISELGLEYLTARGERSNEIVKQMTALKRCKRRRRASPPKSAGCRPEACRTSPRTGKRLRRRGRRDILGDALRRVFVARGRPGEWTPAAKLARLTFDWKVLPNPGEPSAGGPGDVG
jgi:hypothetical protein